VKWAARHVSQDFPSPFYLSSVNTVSSGTGSSCGVYSGFAPATPANWSGFCPCRGDQKRVVTGTPFKKTRQFRAGFSVTPVFRVRIVDPLVAATALKVARKTPPCESERGRQSPVVVESAEGVTQGHLTQRSVMTGSIFEPPRCRFVRVPLLQISHAYSGDLFHNRC
jgi:hypothetical protein